MLLYIMLYYTMLYLLYYIISYSILFYYIISLRPLDLNSCVELPIQSSASNNFRRFFVEASHALTPLQSTLDDLALKRHDLENSNIWWSSFLYEQYTISMLYQSSYGWWISSTEQWKLNEIRLNHCYTTKESLSYLNGGQFMTDWLLVQE